MIKNVTIRILPFTGIFIILIPPFPNLHSLLEKLNGQILLMLRMSLL